jgi:hypothetical protein
MIDPQPTEVDREVSASGDDGTCKMSPLPLEDAAVLGKTTSVNTNNQRKSGH